MENWRLPAAGAWNWFFGEGKVGGKAEARGERERVVVGTEWQICLLSVNWGFGEGLWLPRRHVIGQVIFRRNSCR